MSDRVMTAEELAQAQGEAKLAPHLPAICDTIATLVTACSVNSSELVLVLPESEWADVPPEERAVMVLGCQVIHADVPAPMVAVRARKTFGFEPVTANPPGSSVPWTPPGEKE